MEADYEIRIVALNVLQVLVNVAEGPEPEIIQGQIQGWKKPVFFKKTRPSGFFCFFLFFLGFLGFLCFFGFFCPDERVLGFFQFHEYL